MFSMHEEKLFFFTPAWPVLYLDNHLLGLYKPAGLLVQGDRSGDVSLLELGKLWLGRRYGKPGRVFLGMVQRLDRPVAGVVLFGRTSKAAGRLSEQFRRGTVHKKYVAVVEGRVREEKAHLVNYVQREDMDSKIVPYVSAHTQLAKLSYQVLDSTRSRSLLQVHLETGRRHQIRAQLAHIGHPVLGDKRYGSRTALPQKQIALFAKELVIIHPTQRKELSILSPLPQGWPWPAESPVAAPLEAPPWNWDELHGLIEA
jgi:23S rRNA pseudouridine1911/1915/1917 synthase